MTQIELLSLLEISKQRPRRRDRSRALAEPELVYALRLELLADPGAGLKIFEALLSAFDERSELLGQEIPYPGDLSRPL